MTLLDPALFELHIVFSARRGDVMALSLRPVAPDQAPRFCEFLTEHLNDPLLASVLAYDDRLVFTANPLDARLRLDLPTSFYFDARKLLAMDVPSPLSLGVCHDPLACAFPQTTYIHSEAMSPGPRIRLRFPCAAMV